MATQTKKKEGFFKARKGGGLPELTNKGLILMACIILPLAAFAGWSLLQ